VQYAIIGGTGVYDPGLLSSEKEIQVETPYGKADLIAGRYQQLEIGFVPRHGKGHSVAPHKVNYRAIIWALKSLGVHYVIATNAVGSCNSNFMVGDFVLVDQFIDFTKSRPLTFFDGEHTSVVHVDVTSPYCPYLREALLDLGRDRKLTIHGNGCYVCFEGPRYESTAEVRMAAKLGGDVLGMTGVPEVVLAREAGICYASIGIVTNMGAGLAGEPLSHLDVSKVVADRMNLVRGLALDALVLMSCKDLCTCSESKVPLPDLQES
jgi:5'-methylthioadenosine phosphorylase